MDLATITAAASGLRGAIQTIRTALETKTQIAADRSVLDALTKLGEALDTTYELRDELARLQDENARLKRDERERDEWTAKAAAYRLVKAVGGAMVYEADGPPHHYACPACFESKHIHFLQDQNVAAGNFRCPSCNKTFLVAAPVEWKEGERVPRNRPFP